MAVVAVTLSLASCFGCSATVIGPAELRDPVAVYIADYGRHSSLILPRSETELVEYAFGEWEWYALNRTGLLGIVRALFLPSQGALGRRSLDLTAGEDWAGRLKVVQLLRLCVERSATEALVAELDDRWDSASATRVHNPRYGIDFVHDEQVYTFATNSNPAVARWLEQLGCSVRGPAITSGWRVISSSEATCP